MNIKEQLEEYINLRSKDYHKNKVDHQSCLMTLAYLAGANEMKELLLIAVRALEEYKNGKALLVKPEKRHLYEESVHRMDAFYLRSMSDYTHELLAENALNEIQEKIKGE